MRLDATAVAALLFCQKLGGQLPTLPTRQLRPCHILLYSILVIIFVCNHVVSDNKYKESEIYTKNTRLGVNVLFALKHFVCL